MKKALLPLCAIALLATGCEDTLKDAVQTKVNMQQSGIEFDIPPVPTAGQELAITGEPAYYNVDSLIKSSNSQWNFVNVKAISIQGCEVEILNQGANNHWGHLQDATASVHSNAQTTPVDIANVVNNPATAVRTLNLNPTNADLSAHLNANTFYYTLRVKNRTPTTDTLHCRATVRYELTLGL